MTQENENLDISKICSQIKKKKLLLSELPLEMQLNPDLALAAINSGHKLSELHPSHLSNLKLMCMAIRKHHNESYLPIIPSSIQKTPEFLLASLPKMFIEHWKTLPQELKENKTFFTQALMINPKVYSFASEFIQLDKPLALMVIKKHSHTYSYLHKDLKKDEHIIWESLQRKPSLILSLPHCYRDDKKTMLMLVKHGFFELATDRLKDDDEVAFRAIKSNCSAIGHASKRLKNNRIMAETAMQHGFDAMPYVSDELKNDLNFMFYATQKNIKFFSYCGQKLKAELGDITNPLIAMERLMLMNQTQEYEQEINSIVKAKKLKI